MVWIIVIVILAIIVIWGISAQRSLVSADELCGNALSQIGVQQQSRWDALTALAELTKGYSEHEYKTMMDVIGNRRAITTSSTPEQIDQQETLISEALRQVSVVVEQYPDLKANTTYLETMGKVNTYEQQVRMSRMTYNDSVTRFNRMVRQFPTSIIAGFCHFSSKEYLQMETVQNSAMPSMA